MLSMLARTMPEPGSHRSGRAEFARRPGSATVLYACHPDRGRYSIASAGGHADVAQLVEHHLAKVRVAGSNPVVRSEASDAVSRCRWPARLPGNPGLVPWVRARRSGRVA